jgi:hypothetical protein
MKTGAFRAVISVLVVILLGAYIVHHELVKTLSEMSPIWWVASSAWAWLIMTVSALIVFLARIGRFPDLGTIVFFPICQSIAGYILPVQGSMAFTSVYFKRTHGVSIRRTVSLNLIIGLVSILLLGLTGLAMVVAGATEGGQWAFFSLISVAPPALYASLGLAEVGARFLGPSDIGIKIHEALRRLRLTLRDQARTLATKPAIPILYVLRILLYTGWFVLLDHALGLELETLVLFYMVFAVEAAVIFKLTPGNWGISQASGAVALSLIGEPVPDGVLLITVSMLSILLLDLAVGYFASRHLSSVMALKRFQAIYREADAATKDPEAREDGPRTSN